MFVETTDWDSIQEAVKQVHSLPASFFCLFVLFNQAIHIDLES